MTPGDALVCVWGKLTWPLSKTTRRFLLKQAERMEKSVDWTAISASDRAEIERLKAEALGV